MKSELVKRAYVKTKRSMHTENPISVFPGDIYDFMGEKVAKQSLRPNISMPPANHSNIGIYKYAESSGKEEGSNSYSRYFYKGLNPKLSTYQELVVPTYC